MDLFSPTFRARRSALFDQALSRLELNTYQEIIKQTFRAKQGIQSPFISWGVLTEDLLSAALACIPAAHLRHFFGAAAEESAGKPLGLSRPGAILGR